MASGSGKLTRGAVLVLSTMLGGGLLAVNMGFRVELGLVAADGVGSRTGTQFIALPYSSPTPTAVALLGDVGESGLQVSRWVTESDTLQTYTGFKPFNSDFDLDPGEAVLVKVSTDVDYVAVGSHLPGTTVELRAAQDADSLTGTNWVSVPYHARATTAAELLDEACEGVATQVSRFVTATDTLQTYTGFKPFNADFPLVLGEGVLVKVAERCVWRPRHH